VGLILHFSTTALELTDLSISV